MSSIDFSFCIPTYNRPDTLKTAIASILGQKVECVYEIVISDNSENAETAKAVDEFKDKTKIRYFKNSSNIGSAANFVKVISLAKGRYVWLMGDDDCLGSNALAKVLDLLKKYPTLVYIFASRFLCDGELNTTEGILQPHGIKEDIIFRTGNDLCSAFGGHMSSLVGFISSTVIRKDIWDESCSLVGEPLGNWSHERVILHGIIDKPCAILAGPNVLARRALSEVSVDSNVWIDQGVELWKFAEKIGYDHNLCRKIIRQCFHYCAKMYVLDKALGRRSDNLYSLAKRLECQNYVKSNSIWFVLSIFPRSLLRPLPWLKNKRRQILNLR